MCKFIILTYFCHTERSEVSIRVLRENCVNSFFKHALNFYLEFGVLKVYFNFALIFMQILFLSEQILQKFAWQSKK